MNVRILQNISGAIEAKGITVIVDVFRAFTLEAYLYNRNIKGMIMANSIDQALELRKQNKDIVIFGERHGKRIHGFDFGNSPSQAMKADVDGKIICHKSDSCTIGICTSINATEVLTGAFVNAKATADYIKAKNPEDVSLVCMGWCGVRDTEEDTLCAEYIKSLIEDKPMDPEELDSRMRKLEFTDGVKFFNKKYLKTFPKEDFYMCLDKDKFNFVLKPHFKNNYIEIEKVDL